MGKPLLLSGKMSQSISAGSLPKSIINHKNNEHTRTGSSTPLLCPQNSTYKTLKVDVNIIHHAQRKISTMQPYNTFLRAMRTTLLNKLWSEQSSLWDSCWITFFVNQLKVGKQVFRIVTLVVEYGSVALGLLCIFFWALSFPDNKA